MIKNFIMKHNSQSRAALLRNRRWLYKLQMKHNSHSRVLNCSGNEWTPLEHTTPARANQNRSLLQNLSFSHNWEINLMLRPPNLPAAVNLASAVTTVEPSVPLVLRLSTAVGLPPPVTPHIIERYDRLCHPSIMMSLASIAARYTCSDKPRWRHRSDLQHVAASAPDSGTYQSAVLGAS